MPFRSREPGWAWKASSTSTKLYRGYPENDPTLLCCFGLPYRHVTETHHGQKHRQHFAVVEIPGVEAAHQYAHDYGNRGVQHPAFLSVRRQAAERAPEIE